MVLAGVYAWQKHKESEDAEKLRDAIADLATARLYALASEQSILKQTDQKASRKGYLIAIGTSANPSTERSVLFEQGS